MKIAILLTLLCCVCAIAQTADEITALVKTYFRDSAELPMDVTVTTTIRNPAGKVKSEKHATVHMVFHGYSHTGKATVNAKAGFFDRSEMFDSLNGGLASIVAGTILMEKKDKSHLEVHRPTEYGHTVVVTVDNGDCPPFKVIGGRILFPKGNSLCGSSTYSLTGDTPAGLTFQHFTFNSTNLPAQDKVPEFGDARILTFKIDEDFQSWTMTGETKPFLLPKRVVVSMTTDKGAIEIANQYSPRSAK